MKPGIQLLGNSSVCQGYVTRFKPFPTFLNCQSYFLPVAFVLKRSNFNSFVFWLSGMFFQHLQKYEAKNYLFN